jgi:ABC-type oligopeptide transport system ATPase subunit
MKVINLYGGPGTGKSTTAAGLFYQMKSRGYKVELVTEYAKDLTYDKRHTILKNQEYVFAKQLAKLRRLKGQVDYVITDSPLLMQLNYISDDYDLPILKQLIVDGHDLFDNIEIFLERNLEHHEFQEYGRNQTVQEAMYIDSNIRSNVLKELYVLKIVHTITVSNSTVDEILKIIEDDHE